jgi:hypothetical protein
VPVRAETHHLFGVTQFRTPLEIFAFEPGRIDQHFLRRGLARQRRDILGGVCLYCTGHGFTPQMPDAYSAMVRSVENLPEPATFRMAFRAQARGSA